MQIPTAGEWTAASLAGRSPRYVTCSGVPRKETKSLDGASSSTMATSVGRVPRFVRAHDDEDAKSMSLSGEDTAYNPIVCARMLLRKARSKSSTVSEGKITESSDVLQYAQNRVRLFSEKLKHEAADISTEAVASLLATPILSSDAPAPAPLVHHLDSAISILEQKKAGLSQCYENIQKLKHQDLVSRRTGALLCLLTEFIRLFNHIESAASETEGATSQAAFDLVRGGLAVVTIERSKAQFDQLEGIELYNERLSRLPDFRQKIIEAARSLTEIKDFQEQGLRTLMVLGAARAWLVSYFRKFQAAAASEIEKAIPLTSIEEENLEPQIAGLFASFEDAVQVSVTADLASSGTVQCCDSFLRILANAFQKHCAELTKHVRKQYKSHSKGHSIKSSDNLLNLQKNTLVFLYPCVLGYIHQTIHKKVTTSSLSEWVTPDSISALVGSLDLLAPEFEQNVTNVTQALMGKNLQQNTMQQAILQLQKLAKSSAKDPITTEILSKKVTGLLESLENMTKKYTKPKNAKGVDLDPNVSDSERGAAHLLRAYAAVYIALHKEPHCIDLKRIKLKCKEVAQLCLKHRIDALQQLAKKVKTEKNDRDSSADFCPQAKVIASILALVFTGFEEPDQATFLKVVNKHVTDTAETLMSSFLASLAIRQASTTRELLKLADDIDSLEALASEVLACGMKIDSRPLLWNLKSHRVACGFRASLVLDWGDGVLSPAKKSSLERAGSLIIFQLAARHNVPFTLEFKSFDEEASELKQVAEVLAADKIPELRSYMTPLSTVKQ